MWQSSIGFTRVHPPIRELTQASSRISPEFTHNLKICERACNLEIRIKYQTSFGAVTILVFPEFAPNLEICESASNLKIKIKSQTIFGAGMVLVFLA